MRRGIAIDIRGSRTNCPGAEEAQRCRIDLAEPPPPGPARYRLSGKRRSSVRAIRCGSRAARRSGITACRFTCAASGAPSRRWSSRPPSTTKKKVGRNAGTKLHYYRIAIPMTEIWPDYVGSPRDGLRIEVCEAWLEGLGPVHGETELTGERDGREPPAPSALHA